MPGNTTGSTGEVQYNFDNLLPYTNYTMVLTATNNMNMASERETAFLTQQIGKPVLLH